MKSFLVGTWLMFRTHLSALVFSKRALVCLVLAVGPPVLALFPSHQQDALSVVAVMGSLMFLMVIAPLIGLVAGSAVVNEEVENRTITFVFTRPVPRSALFIGRWAATLVVTSALLATSAVALTQVATFPRASDPEGRTVRHWDHNAQERVSLTVPIDRDLPEGLAGRFAASAVLAGALYSLLAAGLGVFFKRPMIIGLGYTFAVETLLANIPTSIQKMSLQYYLRGIMADLREPPHPGFWSELPMYEPVAFLSPAESVTRLAVVLVLALAVSTWALTRRQFILTS